MNLNIFFCDPKNVPQRKKKQSLTGTSTFFIITKARVSHKAIYKFLKEIKTVET